MGPVTVKQLGESDLSRMTPQQIVAAREAGQLHQLMTGEAPPDIPAEGQLTVEHLGLMTPKQIVDAYESGRTADLTGRAA
jgi:hypothetical protein